MNTLSRRTFLKTLTITGAYPLISKCSSVAEPLKIASHVWSGYELMFLAHREGWLLNNNVQFLETASATESIQALANNTVHGAALTLDEVLRARSQNINLTCVLIFDISAGADMVLSKTNITDLSKLKGQRIGIESTAVGALMLHKLLDYAKLNKTDIIPIELTFDQHLDAWDKNKIDAVITFEPVTSQLLNKGAYKIFDSRKIPNTIFDVLAIKTDILTTQYQHVKSLIAAHFRARNYFYHNTQDAIYKIAIRMDISPSDVLNSFRGLNLPNEEANLKFLSDDSNSLLNSAQNLSNIMLEMGVITEIDNLNNLVTDYFLPKGL